MQSLVPMTLMDVKISQHELAELAQTHQKNISKYEQDLTVPSAITLKRIADCLNVTADYLLGSEVDNTIKDTQLLEQFKQIDKMNDEDKNALMKVIDAYIRDFKTRQAYS